MNEKISQLIVEIKSEEWVKWFRFNPLDEFLKVDSEELEYFIRRDIFDDKVDSVKSLWDNPKVLRILRKQSEDGSWPDKTPKKHQDSPTDYKLLETYRNLGQLHEFYGLDKKHPAIQNAAEFIFSTQTDEGDFRGIYGTQYSTNYSGGLLELLVKIGYIEDQRIIKAFDFFLQHQQSDGGWVLPMQVASITSYESEHVCRSENIIGFDSFSSDSPSSHFVTGIVIRAFSHHPKYRSHPKAIRTANFLMDRVFKKDAYTSRAAPVYWKKYSYPFWWTDLISVLDSLSLMPIDIHHPGLNRTLSHFKYAQLDSGGWDFSILKNRSFPELGLWIQFSLLKSVKRILDKGYK